MIFQQQSSGPSRRLALYFRVATRIAGLALALATLPQCSAFKPAHKLVPGPSGAIAAAPLSRNRVAVLAGDEQQKGIFIVDTHSGQVLKSFGVTRESTGITAEGDDGPLLVSVGGIGRNGRPFGAVERWTLAGTKVQVVPMPAAALWMTRMLDGSTYVLIGQGDDRSAVAMDVPSMRLHAPISLDAGAKHPELCRLGSSDYLAFSGGTQGTIVVREIETGIIVRSSVVADSPTCVDGKQAVFAITKSFAARTIAVLTLPGLLQASVIPASNDASALYQSADHHLFALNSTARSSNVEIFPDDVLDVKAFATAGGPPR
jgi:hypothetical protein